jgi:small subunit ribosomal protein S9
MMAIEQFYGTGRRKAAVARVYLRSGEGRIVVNGKDFQDYFRGIIRRSRPSSPCGRPGPRRFDATVTVAGGRPRRPGGRDQARPRPGPGAHRRRQPGRLKPAGLLTRDAREVERKKYGLKKARKAPQFSKR